MSQEEVSYEEMKKEFEKLLKGQQTGMLATSDGDNVTVRAMWIFSDGLAVYCITRKRSRKYKQLCSNQNVAIAVNDIQIEGVAALKGNPVAEENTRFLEVYKEVNPDVYERRIEGMRSSQIERCLIEITPKRVATFTPDGGMHILNVLKKKAYKLEIGEPAYYE